MQVEAQAGQHQKGQKQNGFGQSRKGGFTAGAHALEGGARIQGRQNQGEAPHAQQIGGQQKIPAETQRRGRAAQGQQGQSAESGGQGHAGPGGEGPGGGAADDLALAQQPGQIIVGLQQGLAPAPGRLGLDPIDDAGQQRGQGQGQQQLDEIGGNVLAHTPSPHISRPTTVARI